MRERRQIKVSRQTSARKRIISRLKQQFEIEISTSIQQKFVPAPRSGPNQWEKTISK
jgi:hypothetical protein